MTTYFDSLPLWDVIHENIVPWLDYDSRIMFNQFLSPEDRMCRRMHKTVLLTHELGVSAKLTYSLVDSVQNAPSLQMRCKKYVTLLNMLRRGQRGVLLAQYFPSFRDAIVNKLQDILDLESDNIRSCTPYFKKKLRTIAGEILPEMLEMETFTPLKRVASIRIAEAIDLSMSDPVFRG
jgi:hypothetical protein